MAGDPVKTLLYPFERGMLDIAKGWRVLFLGAVADGRLADFFSDTDLLCVQGFRPVFLELQRAGAQVLVEPQGVGYDLALVLCGRHRGQNEKWIVEAISRTRSGGLVVVAGAKTDGIDAIRKALASVVRSHTAKHHGSVFWIERECVPDALTASLSKKSAAGVAVEFEQAPPGLSRKLHFETASGMFSHDRADAGSRLLVEHLPAGLGGLAADFCAGWGFLSVALAHRAPGLSGIDLYEADHASLEASRRNMNALAAETPARFFWLDLVEETVAGRYDVIVMNPPFHVGRAAAPSLGEAIIRRARQALKPDGELFLVANRQLPYEQVLTENYSRMEKLCEQDGFKVLRAKGSRKRP